ncbi:MAG TPA: hypothetical protein PLN71_16405 [Anaerolineae bacterium]|nr:hypothetical protein [Anaerolineae bacterium]
MTPDTKGKTLREQTGRYVVDTLNQPVGVLLTLEEYEHYLDLLDDEEDSQDEELQARLTLAAAPQADGERLSLRDYLRQRPPTDVSLQS